MNERITDNPDKSADMIGFDQIMLMLAELIMPAGIMSPARITYIGLTGYLMIHPVINRINPNSVKFRMDDRISGLIKFGAHLYTYLLLFSCFNCFTRL